MIRRISEICNTGNFYDFRNGGQCQFEKLTLIYGLNTYGKSTLVDIMNSLSLNNPQIIMDRKSIGSIDNEYPKVTLNIYDNQRKERSVVFNNSCWHGFNNDYKIEIFDNKYIQSNIFTGLDITRENKLNITEFILGAENVKLANKICDLKKQKRDKGTDIRTIEGTITKMLPKGVNLSEFLSLKTRENCNEVVKEKNKIKEALENRIKFSQKILGTKKVDQVQVDLDIIQDFKEINLILGKTYSDINNDALESIKYHLHSNFLQSDSNSEMWIKDGILKYYKENGSEQSKCPFCGQTISDSVDLIDVYKRYFCEAYQNFTENVIGDLRKSYTCIRDRAKLIGNSQLKDSLIYLKGCFEYITENDFKDNVNLLEAASMPLYDSINEYVSEIGNLLEQSEAKAKQKKERPYEIVKPIDLEHIESIAADINLKLESVNEIINRINIFIEKTKKSIQGDEIAKMLENIERDIFKLELEQLRDKCKDICISLSKEKEKYKALTVEISEKQSTLAREMDDFLNLYFDKINRYLQVFGTKSFQIGKKIATNGDMPVISLCVKFKGQEINEKNLKNVLSESDMRALALSIFWAKLSTSTNESLANTIVILDDPITSFDNNRTRAAISEIFNLYNKCAQIIILSHYESFINTFLACHNGNCELKVIKINKDNKTSYLENCDLNEFILDAHDKMLEKIDNFISGEIDEDISKDLRVYFENEFKRRYRYQIIKLGVENLMMKDLVIKLKENFIISNDISEKVLDLLRILNPEHHIYIPSNPEEWRNIASDVLNFIFKVLTVTQNQSPNIA